MHAILSTNLWNAYEYNVFVRARSLQNTAKSSRENTIKGVREYAWAFIFCQCYRLIRQMWIGCRRQVYGARSRKMCCSCTVMLAETSHHQHSSYGMHLCTVINTTFSCWSMGRLVEHRATSNLSRTQNMLADVWQPICGISSNRACERKVWHVLVIRWALIYVDNYDDTLASGCRR